MPKIGIDLRMSGVLHGGIGRYVNEIAKRLPGLEPNAQFVYFYRPSSPDLDELISLAKLHKNIELCPVESRHYSISEQTVFLKKIQQKNLDLIHFPNFNVPIFYKGKFVVTLHDVIHHKLGGAKKSHWLHFLAYKKIIKTAAEKSQSIITVSEYSKKEIAKTFSLKTDKIEVTYEGTSLPANINESQIEQVKKNYYLNKPYFIFVGVMEKKKNLINLTRGFDLFLKKTKLDMDLVIVGKVDRHYSEIKYEALDISYKNHLVFTGFVEDSELAALYAGAHAFVSASIYEGFGLPGVEAMKYNLPLVVSNIEVFNEIYDNAAIYFDPLNVEDIAEKLGLIATDSGLYRQMQLHSKQRESLFSWDNCAKQTLEVYQKALK